MTTLNVPPEKAGARLDRLLAEAYPERSRTFWQREIQAGRVTLNGRPAKARDLPRTGDRIVIDAEPEGSAPPAPTPVPVPVFSDPLPRARVLYVDESLLIVDKPRGMVVHPARGHWDDTLVHHLGPWLQGGDDLGTLRPGIVHRLDKDTTGCLVVARTGPVRDRLSEAIRARTVERWYLAVVEGVLDPPAGVVDAPIGRDPGNRLKMAPVLRGRTARTHYLTVAVWRRASLLLLKLETGRTHQIRVHLSAIGHPVAGDALYGARMAIGFESQALHAWRVRFPHPLHAGVVTAAAPVPADWSAVLGGLGPADGPTSWDFPGPFAGTRWALSAALAGRLVFRPRGPNGV